LVETLVGAEQKFTFSFNQFVGYLGTIDLRHSNVHYRTQTHELEPQLSPGSVFLLGLPQTDPQQYRISSHHAIRSLGAPAQFIGDQLFEFSDRGQASVPDYRSFYNRDLEQRVYHLYAEDFFRYGFSTVINRRDL
jgi:hypothetical protein